MGPDSTSTTVAAPLAAAVTAPGSAFLWSKVAITFTQHEFALEDSLFLVPIIWKCVHFLFVVKVCVFSLEPLSNFLLKLQKFEKKK